MIINKKQNEVVSINDFAAWLRNIGALLPPKMKLAESWELWKRKVKEEEELYDNQ